MRIALVGTDLARVERGAGALESLLWGWAEALAGDHDVHVVSVDASAAGEPGVAAAGFERHRLARPEDLEQLTAGLAADVVVLNNRPAWQRWVGAPTLHLFHNWPDAWGTTGREVDVGGAGAAAVSAALAAVVAAALGRTAGDVGVVRPFVDEAFVAVAPATEADVVLAPNRLLAKKGVRELVAASERPTLEGRRVLVTDYLSPWTAPTAEHLELRALVRSSSRCTLVPPPASRAAMAALYARAAVAVVPSTRPEGLGMTAVEAQAAGVPVVSSGLGGLGEVTLPPGAVADPGDRDALAAAVVSAAAAGLQERAALRAAIAARFSMPASLASLLAALERARPARSRSG